MCSRTYCISRNLLCVSLRILPSTHHPSPRFLASPSLSSFALCDFAADSADDVLRRRERPWALHLLRLLWPRQYWKLPGYVERGTTTTRNKLTCVRPPPASANSRSPTSSFTPLRTHPSSVFCPRFFLIHRTGPHGHLGAACDCSTCPNSPYCDVPTCCGGDNPDLCDFSGAIGQSNTGFCPGPHGACNTCSEVWWFCVASVSRGSQRDARGLLVEWCTFVASLPFRQLTIQFLFLFFLSLFLFPPSRLVYRQPWRRVLVQDGLQ